MCVCVHVLLFVYLVEDQLEFFDLGSEDIFGCSSHPSKFDLVLQLKDPSVTQCVFLFVLYLDV